MYNLNEWHKVERDSTAPTLQLESGLRPKLFFGTETFIYNMIARDDGEDISSSIRVITDGMLKSHVEGAASLTFSVLDSGGNEATLNTDVDVVGGWVQDEAIVHDFLSLTELPSNLTLENDTTYKITETGLQFTGSRPPSPYWNLIHQMNANGAAQFTVRGEGAGMTFRWRDSDNFNWAVILGGTIEIRERVNGAWLSRGALAIEDYDPTADYMLGLEALDDIVKVYIDGDKLGDIKVYDNLYATGWGLWSNSGNVTISKAMFAKPGDVTFGTYDMKNQAPTANAGPDQSVKASTEFILNGSGSQDTDGTIVEWQWTQTAGDNVTLDLEVPSMPKAIAPSKMFPQQLTFELITVDDKGSRSSPSSVNVNVAANELGMLDKTLSLIKIKSKVGIEDDIQALSVISLYQYSDNFILCEIVDQASATLDSSLFKDAEYRLVDQKGKSVSIINLHSGIRVIDNKFLIHINKTILNNSHKGSLRHQFVVWNQAGYKLPPIFSGSINIIPVLEPTA